MLTALLLCVEVHLHGQDGELRQYVLKREFAEGAIYMTMPQFPAEALLLAQNGPGTLYRFGQLPFRDNNTFQARISQERTAITFMCSPWTCAC